MRLVSFVVVVVVVLAACGASSPPTTTGGARRENPATEIPMCAGQGSPPPAGTSRTGPMELQLAPAFLDRMPACSADAAAPLATLVDAAAGTVNAKGDCGWANGVTCHYHVGVEFVAANVPRPQLDELHCIFPVAGDPKSPRVVGTHFTCKAGTSLATGHDVHAGEVCGATVLAQLAAMAASCDARCCDDGTLTNPTGVRTTGGTLDVRPDFRICARSAELDCTALATMTGHPANAPVYGAPVD